MIPKHKSKQYFISTLLAFVLCIIATQVYAAPVPNKPYKVDSSNRFLIRDNGNSFFYLADTVWALIASATPAEADEYLRVRKEQGFTSIHTTLLFNFTQPFNNNDITQLRSAFWDRADYILRKAAQEGLSITLVPVWGNLITNGTVNTSNAYALGKLMGERYRDLPIVWMLGGDYNPTGFQSVYDLLVQGITEGSAGENNNSSILATFQSDGGKSSTDYMANIPWLDLSVTHPGHCDLPLVYQIIEREYLRTPTRPILSGEAIFEHLPRCFDLTRGAFTDQEIRRSAYPATFAGATGFSYGGYESYMMWDTGEAFSWGSETWGGVDTPWRIAQRFPAAEDMQHLRSLTESRPMLTRIPDQSMILSGAGNGFNRVQATRASDGSYAFIYTAYGNPLAINSTNLSGTTLKGWWFNPREGTAQSIGDIAKSASTTFTPPTRGTGNDWVLVLDDASRNFSQPGTRNTSFFSICGNGIVEGIEQCDGGNLNGATCQSRGYVEGTLSCSASCTFATAQCSLQATPPPPPPTPVQGDMDDDGIVNISDWVFMRTYWGTGNSRADINRDGIVNSFDYAYLHKNWHTGE